MNIINIIHCFVNFNIKITKTVFNMSSWHFKLSSLLYYYSIANISIAFFSLSEMVFKMSEAF